MRCQMFFSTVYFETGIVYRPQSNRTVYLSYVDHIELFFSSVKENFMASNHSNSEKDPNKWTLKRIAAVIGIVLLLAMYVAAFVSAIGGFPGADTLFRASLGLTIGVPLLLWVLIWCIGRFTGTDSIADLKILNSNPEERAKMEEAIQSELESGEED